MKLKSTADGLKAVKVNDHWPLSTEWETIQANNPALDLTTTMPGNTVFEGVEVWRTREIGHDKWNEIDESDINNYDLMYNEVKQFYQPLEVKEQVREEVEVWDKTNETINPKASNPEYGNEAYEYNSCVNNGQSWRKCNNAYTKEWAIENGFEIRLAKAFNPELESTYPFSEVRLIATRFARQSRLMNDVTSNDTITSFDNWFEPAKFKATQQQGLVSLESVIDVLQKWCLSKGAAFIAPDLLELLKTLKQ